MSNLNRNVTGGAKATVPTAPLTNVSPGNGGTFTVADASGWPTTWGVAKINATKPTEEKILYSSRSGNVLTVATGGRGFDGTVAADHAVTEPVTHDWDAVAAQYLIDHVNDVRDDHGQYMRADGTRHDLTARHGTAVIADNAITNAKAADMANLTVKGRITAGSGDPEDLTPTQLRTLAGLTIGSNVQAWDADLDALAALSSAADKMPYTTGPQAWALAALTAFARTLLDDVDAATMRATLGLGALATHATVDAANLITDGIITRAKMASEAWTGFTPVLTQGVTISKTINYANFFSSGRMRVFQCKMTATSNGTSGQPIEISVPDIAAFAGDMVVGSFNVIQVPVNNIGIAVLHDTTHLRGICHASTDYLGTNPSLQVVTNTIVHFLAVYETAT